MHKPAYIKLLESGELKKRTDEAERILRSCDCCPHDCKSDRTKNEYGICASGYMPIVSSYTSHFGEEPVLSGPRGAGNIFFGNCNLKCVYCQNHEISQNWKSEIQNEVSVQRLSDIMFELQECGCHNIGLVSPSHFSPQILQAVYLASKKGLHLPIIYNTNAYDSVEMLKLYDGVAEIYLPDIKYGNNDYGHSYSKIRNYFDHAKRALKEMFRQVGDELIYDNDVIIKGLIIRHLVLPNNLAESEEVFKFISRELGTNVYISLMSQYHPVHKAKKYELLNRRIRESEYERALDLMHKYGLYNGWIQDMDSYEHYLPEFNKDRANPFGN
ncbi:MAG: radical SAM protein [Ignavibacteria bacterium]